MGSVTFDSECPAVGEHGCGGAELLARDQRIDPSANGIPQLVLRVEEVEIAIVMSMMVKMATAMGGGGDGTAQGVVLLYLVLE